MQDNKNMYTHARTQREREGCMKFRQGLIFKDSVLLLEVLAYGIILFNH